jgi:hypothetical protein
VTYATLAGRPPRGGIVRYDPGVSDSVPRHELERLGELLGLSVLAVTLPLLDVFGDVPEQFVFRGATSSTDIVVFGLVVAFAPAILLWLPGAVTRMADARAGRFVHLAAVAIALFCLLLQLLGMSGLPKLLLAGAGTILGVWLFDRVTVARLWSQMLALGAPVAVGMFLFGSSTGALAFSDPPELVELAESPPSPTSAPDGDGEPDGDPLPRFPDVVMIVLDSLPTGMLLDDSGAIDRRRFPEVADFADEATWYRRYTTVNARTGVAIPAMLSGRMPTEAVSPTWTEYPDTIFRLLGGTYHLTASEIATRLCPEEWCGPSPIPPPPPTISSASTTPRSTAAPTATTTTAPEPSPSLDRGGLTSLIGDAIDVLRDQIALERDPEPVLTGFEETYAQTSAPSSTSTSTSSTTTTAPPLSLNDEPTTEELGAVDGFEVFPDLDAELPRVEEFRAAIQPSDEPTFHYLHIVLPHAPYVFAETGAPYTSPGYSTLTEAEWDSEVNAQRMALQMQFTDQLIGDMLDDLRAAGSYDDALVVLTADHAAGLDDRRLFRYFDGTNAAELMVTPLFIKQPRQTVGVVSDAPMETTDVLPTIADVLDVEVPWTVDGVSALDHEADYDDPSCDDVRHFVRIGRGLLNGGVDDDTEFFEFCANDVVPDGLVARLDTLRPDDEWATASLARLTPFADLLGTDWTDLAATAGGTSVTLDLAAETLNGSSPPVGVVGGTLDEPITEEWVAVAIDGRIAGISPVYDIDVNHAVTEYVERATYLDLTVDDQFRVIVPSPLLHERGYDVKVASLATVGGELVATELAITD